MHEKGVGEEVSYSYLQLAQSLEEHVGKMFNEWISLVEKELSRHLEMPLMQRSLQSKYVRGGVAWIILNMVFGHSNPAHMSCYKSYITDLA